MLWLLFLGLTILVWASYDVFYKILGNEINGFLALFMISLFQLAAALPFLIYGYFAGELNATIRSYYITGLMGVLLAAGTIFFFYTFKYGAPVSVALPAYGIGTLLIGALAGAFIFKETITPLIMAGYILGTISIILLTVK